MKKTREELEALKAQLATLNTAVDEAIKARTEWMDAHMADFAVAQVGEMLYKRENDSFVALGIVDKLYRYHAGQNPLYDTTMSVSYKYESPAGSNCFDNTSRQGFLWLATEADIEEHERQTLERLQAKFIGRTQ